MKKVLSMRNDSKAYLIGEAGGEFGFSVEASPFKRNSLFFIFLIWKIVSLDKPKVVMVRYMNDHPNLLISLVIAFNILSTVVICRVFRIRVFWILHNVDKETGEAYPRLVRFLRAIVGGFARAIFVTDPLLVPVAQKLYPQWAKKIDYITFGFRKDKEKIETDTELINKLESLRGFREKGGLVLFCPTAAGDKYTHIVKSAELCVAARNSGFYYKLVIVGNLKSYLDSNPRIKKMLYSNEDIILINRYVAYESSKISPLIDVYWRSLSDQSVSFTLYEAASVEKPLLTLEEGFMGEAVKKYKMGAVLRNSMSNIKGCNSEILRWEGPAAKKFLEGHSWKVAAEQLSKYLD